MHTHEIRKVPLPRATINQSDKFRSGFHKTGGIDQKQSLRGDVTFNESKKEAIDEPTIKLHNSEDTQW